MSSFEKQIRDKFTNSKGMLEEGLADLLKPKSAKNTPDPKKQAFDKFENDSQHNPPHDGTLEKAIRKMHYHAWRHYAAVPGTAEHAYHAHKMKQAMEDLPKHPDYSDPVKQKKAYDAASVNHDSGPM